MMITNKLKLDLQTPDTIPTVNTVQNDSYSRNLEITLYSNHRPIVFPEKSLDYVYGERSGSCTLKWQGSSSLSYPKKNYTIKFDNAFEAATGWGEQKKYCLKANYRLRVQLLDDQIEQIPLD